MQKTNDSSTVVTYAINKLNQKVVCISEVKRGKACGCICPNCGGDLIARKGKQRLHHFAHASGVECVGFCQTELHLLAKELFAECEYIILPALSLCFDGKTYLLSSIERVSIYDVKLEKSLEEGYVPDVILNTDIGKIIIEIYVTNKTGYQKLTEYSARGYMALEIRLNNFSRDVKNPKVRDELIKTIKDK